MRCSFLVLIVVGALSPIGHQAFAEDRPVRIGVYDSRVVAYAHFWTDAVQKKHQSQMAEAKAAEQSGDKEKLDKLKNILRLGQRQAHRQVFSTAPVDNVLEEIKDRLPEIKKQAGVSVLISKWNKTELKQYPSAGKVDVTDLLVQVFKPTEKHLKMIESIKKAKPVSLEQAEQCH